MTFWNTVLKKKQKQHLNTAVPDAMIQLGRVVADASRCVQCGICGYNCPVGIPVRDYARQGLPVSDTACISCGNCINVCPRGTLRWETESHLIVMARFATQMGEIAD